MLKLAKGTHILGLIETRSHGTISQYFFVFFGTYPEREFTNDPLIHNGKKKSKELSEVMSYGKLFTQLFVHSVSLLVITHNSKHPLPNKKQKQKKTKLKAITKHYA